MKKLIALAMIFASMASFASSYPGDYCFGGGDLNSISITFSDGKGTWDSKNGTNYFFPTDLNQENNCVTTNTNDLFTSNIPLSIWEIINKTMND